MVGSLHHSHSFVRPLKQLLELLVPLQAVVAVVVVAAVVAVVVVAAVVAVVQVMKKCRVTDKIQSMFLIQQNEQNTMEHTKWTSM